MNTKRFGGNYVNLDGTGCVYGLGKKVNKINIWKQSILYFILHPNNIS